MRTGVAAILVGAALLATTGCTHLALQKRTVKQASTLTDLQYEQVLDNLAMFVCNPEAMPWHVKVKGGTVQIADQGSGGFTADIAAAMGGEVTRLIPSAGAQRGILNQWDVEPASGADDLELLTLAYQKAVRPYDSDLDIEIRFAIWQLLVTYPETASGSEVLLDIMKDAVQKESKRIDSELQKALAQEDSQAVSEARANIENGFKRLEALVESERLGVDNLSSFTCDAEQIKTKVEEVTAEFKCAHELLLKGPDILAKTRRRINLIVQPSSEAALIYSVLRLNPFRSAVRERNEPCLNIALRQLCSGTKEGDPYVRFLTIAGHERYLPSQAKPKTETRNPALVEQAESKITKLKEMLEEKEFLQPWFCWGGKQDVPKCACYVGNYCACGCDCYVWVMPDQLKNLREFTLTVLTLAPLTEQDIRGGAAFSPSLR